MSNLFAFHLHASVSHRHAISLVMKVKAEQPVPYLFYESNLIQLGVNLYYSVLAKEQRFLHTSLRLC